jgi:hypothetical protein
MIEQLLPKNVASSYQDGGLSLADLKTDNYPSRLQNKLVAARLNG